MNHLDDCLQGSVNAGHMEDLRQAWTIILRRLGGMSAARWFGDKLDVSVLPRYLSSIAPSHPTSLSEAELWLNRTSSDKLDALQELRRPMLNALRFNVGPGGSVAIRTDAVKLLHKLDDEVGKSPLLCSALAQHGRPFVAARKKFREAGACEAALESFAKEPGSVPGSAAVGDFWFPFASYFSPGDPKVADYVQRIAFPICLADVCVSLYNGEYESLDSFCGAVTRVFENAREFWGPTEAIFGKAADLRRHFEILLQASLQVHAPMRGPAVEIAPAAPALKMTAPADRLSNRAPQVPLPPPPAIRPERLSREEGRLTREEGRRCLDLLSRLESATATSAFTGKTVRLADPFLLPISQILVQYPEYGRVISNPIDLHIIRAKLEQDPPDYASLVEFSADVLLMVSNCKEFNSDPDSHDLVWLADKVWDRFRGLFNDAFVGAATAAHQPSKYPPGQTTHGLRKDTEPRKGGLLVDSAAATTSKSLSVSQVSAQDGRGQATRPPPATGPSGSGMKLVLKLAAAPVARAEEAAHVQPEQSMTLMPSVPQSLVTQSSALGAAAAPPPHTDVSRLVSASSTSSDGNGVRRRVTLRVGSEESRGPRTLYDIPLATNKALQENILDRLLFRLCSSHPYSSFFQEPFLAWRPGVYREMARRGVTQISDMQYGLRVLYKVKFKDDHYATVGDLNADVSALFARGLSIHTHAEWSTMNEELQLHASEMARRSTRLQEYWRALIVEYFFHVEDIGEGELHALREAREKFIDDMPVLPSTRSDLIRVLSHMAKFDKKKFFSKPAHEIWTHLPRFWVKQPIDLRTMRERVDSGYYATYKQFLNELYLVYDNAIEYNQNAPPTDEGATIRAAADDCIWEVVVPWSDRTLEIYAKCESDGLSKAIADRTAKRAREQEAEAEERARAASDAEEARRRLLTVSGLVAELDSMSTLGEPALACAAIPHTEPGSGVSIEALLLSAQGCPEKPPRSIDPSLLPRLRIALLSDQLADALQDIQVTRESKASAGARLRYLRRSAVSDGRALTSLPVMAAVTSEGASKADGLGASSSCDFLPASGRDRDPVSSIAGFKRARSP